MPSRMCWAGTNERTCPPPLAASPCLGQPKNRPLASSCATGPDKSSPMFILRMSQGARAHLPWRSTIMHARTLLVSLLITPLLAQSAQSASTQPVRWHPCTQIKTACTQAGFVPNGTKRGLGIMADCIRPIMLGTPQRMRATKGLPQIDPQVVAACAERNPNFGKGGRSKAQPSGA